MVELLDRRRQGLRDVRSDSRRWLMPTVTINLPDDGTEFETVTQFAAYVAGFTGDSSTGGVKIPLAVEFSEKYDALKITDRPGETLFFIAFARKQLDHYGDDDDE